MVKKNPLLAASWAVLLVSGVAAAQSTPEDQGTVRPHAGMLRWPDVSANSIVFSYANDLWVVAREGGLARPLASPPGQESHPRFSPDGKEIAFLGNYDGNRDLYVIPTVGGIPRRVTHHPASEILDDWLADGRLLFHASGFAGMRRMTSLLTVPAEGGLPTRLPIPYGAYGAIRPDGKLLAYTPMTRDERSWKRYMGGLASDLWLFDLETGSSRQLTDWGGTDTQPMWHGQHLYYLSDAGPAHRLNLWKLSTVGAPAPTQITHFEDFDCAYPAIGPGPDGQGEIVFRNGANLYLMGLSDEIPHVIHVEVPGESTHLRPHPADAARDIQSWGISPHGKRAVVSARGDIWTLPAEHGSPRNLTHSDRSTERFPSWSPDGRWIAYFSDSAGDYELFMTQSDGKGETRRLTTGGGLFKTGVSWSPDSKRLLYSDKSGAFYLYTLEDQSTKLLERAPWGEWGGGISHPSWSQDSSWLTYSVALGDLPVSQVVLYELESGARHIVTSPLFNSSEPVFDRKGEWLYFKTTRSFHPRYSDLDTTFIYDHSEVLVAVPLRSDIESPWAPKDDEVDWNSKDDDEGNGGGEDHEKEPPSSRRAPSPPADGISGTWEGSLSGPGLPDGGASLSMVLTLSEDGTLGGSITTPIGDATLSRGRYDPASGRLEADGSADNGLAFHVSAQVDGIHMNGSVAIPAMGMKLDFQADFLDPVETEESPQENEDDSDREGAATAHSATEKEEKEPLRIDLDGFEARALQLPVAPGSFHTLAVNDKDQLLYVRAGESGSAIQLFDLKDDERREKTVAKGAGAFMLSTDGKKLLIPRGRRATIQSASAGSSGKTVPTNGMRVVVDPRHEWKEIYNDAWRIMRDYFYDPGMHGVDWNAVRENYERMLDYCASREDVNYVLQQIIAELNVGHAYLLGPGETESTPSTSVGMLGVDFELHDGAYRIAHIHRAAPRDLDSRGPLERPGLEVHEGDYLLAVNGVALDPARDPWAAFQGLAGHTITLTLSAKPTLDESAREVLVVPSGNDQGLRYREWVEHNRTYVDRKSGGRVGYIHVPDTGIRGQNELYRQFFGQLSKDALIIDDRWNGGGQIPTRFIELLARPLTNYWAVRDGRDLPWPPDGHRGPKCMLINGAAGSGGDAFPYYFRQAELGPLIGRRTWGGLIGISGYPPLLDGGMISAPSFAFYELDGTWGIEGHGVDPDIPVMDDPSALAQGDDPQLDAAIAEMMKELEEHPPVAPKRPDYLDRSGMGVDRPNW